LYFSLDQINNVLIHGNRADMPASVWKPSLAFVSVGLVLKFAHKTSQRIRYPARLFAAPRGSQFYHYDE
jgi:hypothetical protein